MDYQDIIPASDQVLLLLHALGGSEIPDVLLKGVRFPQRRWNSNGEIELTEASELGLPPELVSHLSNEAALNQVTASSPHITKRILHDGTTLWSLCSEFMSFLSHAILAQTKDALGDVALRLICFACPACYEGNTTW